MNPVETPHSRLFDIPHSMVGMQSLLKAQRCCSSIRDHKLEAQFRAKRGAIHQTKCSGPPSLRLFVAFGEHADCDRITAPGDRLQVPRRRTDEPVCRRSRIARLASKPRETNWHATTNCVAVIPSRLCAEEEYFLFARRLPRGDVRAVKVYLPYSFGRGDPYLGHSAVSFHDLGNAWQSEPAIQPRNCIFHL